MISISANAAAGKWQTTREFLEHLHDSSLQ
jgi:hypothetical protein